jgi:NTP pyrophosphatase (non-canonical NTP hydrolase)
VLVNTPPAIGHMVPRLTEFVELMAGKLMVNVHKDDLVAKDIPVLLDRLAEEVAEFKDEITAAEGCEIDVNALEELADMGNFCFLLYQYLREQGVRNVTERFIEEYYDIRPDEGRVYCKKSRSGSSLKPGDEVKGTVRRGRVYIRAQHAITGAAISLPRAT